MMIHDFDMARFLLGDDVRNLWRGDCLVDPAIGEAGISTLPLSSLNTRTEPWVQLITAEKLYTVMTSE